MIDIVHNQNNHLSQELFTWNEMAWHHSIVLVMLWGLGVAHFMGHPQT